MMKRNILVLLLILCMFLLSGCVVGQKIDYASGPIPNLKEKGEKTVAVGVHDQRPYVTNTEKYPRYVGTFRGGFGNPFDAETVSNKPLANDMHGILEKALENAEYKVVSLEVVFSDSKEAILLKYKNSGAERFILLTLNEWRNDTYVNTSIYYDVLI